MRTGATSWYSPLHCLNARTECLIDYAGRFELFLDLLYVAILANFAESLAEDVTGVKLVKYIVRPPSFSLHIPANKSS